MRGGGASVASCIAAASVLALFALPRLNALAAVYYARLDLVSGGRLDFENILPSAMMQFAPVGILGLLLAGLIAAFMSTFASPVNAAPAYLINDLYKRYINPEASRKKLIYGSYAISVLVVVVSTLIGMYVESINSVLQWLVSGLWGGHIDTEHRGVDHPVQA